MQTVFDPHAAAGYGAFVDAAYAMFAADPGNPYPAPVVGSIAGYELVAYVTMRDFLLSPGDQAPSFYGFIAAQTGGSQYVLAIRGTDDFVEFYADLHVGAVAFAAVPNSGSVVDGFSAIYGTLQVVTASLAADAQIDTTASFGAQVTQAVRTHRAASDLAPRVLPVHLPPHLVVAAHSLGAALATLFVMESAYRNSTLPPNSPAYLSTPGVFTFGSPATGDATFAALYAAYGQSQGIATWRIVNAADFVPNLPPAIGGWRQVGAERLYDSHDSVFTLRRAHAMATYEALLDAATA